MREESRKCCRCRRAQPIGEFHFKNRAQGTRALVCRGCKKGYNRRWYAKNRVKHVGDVKKNNRRYRTLAIVEIRKRKAMPCVDCKQKYPYYVMDFDHLDPKLKRTEVSKLTGNGSSLRSLLAEIEKCELVCANCHRVRTHQRSLRDGRRRSS